MSELKIGDKVRITKPEEPEETCWKEGMQCFISKVSEKEFISSNNASADLEDTVYGFPLSSLTLVEEVTKQVTEKVAKQIDWEQRRWELLTALVLNKTLIEEVMVITDNAIEYCKKAIQTNTEIK